MNLANKILVFLIGIIGQTLANGQVQVSNYKNKETDTTIIKHITIVGGAYIIDNTIVNANNNTSSSKISKKKIVVRGIKQRSAVLVVKKKSNLKIKYKSYNPSSYTSNNFHFSISNLSQQSKFFIRSLQFKMDFLSVTYIDFITLSLVLFNRSIDIDNHSRVYKVYQNSLSIRPPPFLV